MTFKIITLGCKINAYESQALKEQLLALNYKEVDDTSAEYVFVNTCAVTSTAEKKDFKVVREISRDYKNAKIIVMGCSSQLHKDKYLSIQNVYKVYGTSKRHQIVEELSSENHDCVVDNSRLFKYDNLNISFAEHEVRAYIKIQDGCNNFCSYCIVPYSRGVSRMRDKDDILNEAKRLIDNGYKELVISGIDVGSYYAPSDPKYRLKHLLKDLLEISNKEYRIRVSSIESSQIDEEYIYLFKNNPDKLCPHFHIPLQSGSEKILKLMNRKYDLEYFKKMTDLIKKEVKNVALSTDVITGFPGEDEEEFRKTFEFIKEVGFMRIHAFPYSERPNTVAATLPNSVDKSIRSKRTKELIELSEKLDRDFRLKLKGNKVKVLIESKVEDGLYKGYSENYLECYVKSDVDIVSKFIEYEI